MSAFLHFAPGAPRLQSLGDNLYHAMCTTTRSVENFDQSTVCVLIVSIVGLLHLFSWGGTPKEDTAQFSEGAPHISKRLIARLRCDTTAPLSRQKYRSIQSSENAHRMDRRCPGTHYRGLKHTILGEHDVFWHTGKSLSLHASVLQNAIRNGKLWSSMRRLSSCFF